MRSPVFEAAHARAEANQTRFGAEYAAMTPAEKREWDRDRRALCERMQAECSDTPLPPWVPPVHEE